jgi:hypothetical protein
VSVASGQVEFELMVCEYSNSQQQVKDQWGIKRRGIGRQGPKERLDANLESRRAEATGWDWIRRRRKDRSKDGKKERGGVASRRYKREG